MTALVLLSHERADHVNRMTRYWQDATSPDHLVVAYGGPESEFAAIVGPKVFVTDARLRTRDNQREKQSYTEALQAAVAVIKNQRWDSLYLAEYDMLPLAHDLWQRLGDLAAEQSADLLCHRAWRIDDTLHPHLRQHLASSAWMAWLAGFSQRPEKSVILSGMGCGQWWQRDTIEAALALGEPVPAYLELQLPTVAHHLGFRVRGMGEQDRFVLTAPLSPGMRESMKAEGAWVIHPDKTLWQEQQSRITGP
jgi:hypothetical protein